jgi:hypothetical protein
MLNKPQPGPSQKWTGVLDAKDKLSAHSKVVEINCRKTGYY